MTSAELTEIRTLIYDQYKAWITAGCKSAYTINSNGNLKSFTNVDHKFWTDQLAQLDAQLARASSTGGSVYVANFRDPE
jgi:hypothetical protein